MIKEAITISRILNSILLFHFMFSCFAGESDLQTELSYGDISNLSLYQTGEFSITVTNNGPDTAGAESQVQRPISATVIVRFEGGPGFPVEFIQDLDQEQECFFATTFVEPRPPNPLAVAYEFYYPPIEAGQSTTCFGKYFMNFRQGTRAVEWYVRSPIDDDPNPDNDTETMVFGAAIPIVPVFSVYGLSLFMFLVFLSAVLAFKSKRIDRSINN